MVGASKKATTRQQNIDKQKNDAQKWKLIENGDGSFSLESVSSAGKHLTITSLADLGNAVLQSAGAGTHQKFLLEKRYGNIYFLKIQSNDGFSLDGNGDDCYIYNTNGTRPQQFALIPAGGGTEEHPVLSSSAAYSENGEYMTVLTDSRGNSVNYAYNEDRGYVTEETDPKGNTTSYTYTAGEQLATVTSGGSTVSYGYNAAKQLTTITTPGGSVYGITYDTFGRKSGVTVGSQSLASYTYTDLGQTETVTYGNNTVTRYVYDDLGRLIETFVNDVPQARYVYDGSSRIHEQYDLVGNRKVKFEYDLLGREVKRSLYDTTSGALLSAVRTSYDDTKNRIAGYEVETDGVTSSYAYSYGENGSAPDAVTSVQINGEMVFENEYDYLNRLSTRTLNTTTHIETSYTYLQGADPTKTTTLVSSMQVGSDTFTYTYDANGNITSISKNGTVVESYTYDSKNQLSSVTRGSDTWVYEYDSNGNILSVTKNGEEEKYYAYTDTNWKDLLTEYNGWDITYDAIGNPLEYRNGITMTWSNGRKLASFSKNNLTTTFTYDGDGNRIRKQRGNAITDYTVIDGVIYAEYRSASSNSSMHFLFDENGTRIGFVHNGTDTYYYRFNLQGDITGIYNSAGNLIVEYTYDAWGELESTTGNTLIGMLNPFRYRGYYYDTETGLYYLQTRYYDPETGRFINADGVVPSESSSIHGFNQFVYCFNNPVNMDDHTGHWPKWVKNIAKKVEKAVKTTVAAIKKDIKKVVQDVKNFNIKNTNEQKVLESNYISAYKGVPVIRGGGKRSGSLGIIYLTHETNSRDNPEGILRHEYGHTKQLEELGLHNYLLTVGLPSYGNWGDKWGGGIYEQKPWEVMADIYGGTELKPHTQNDINAAYKYQRVSKKLGSFVWMFIE